MSEYVGIQEAQPELNIHAHEYMRSNQAYSYVVSCDIANFLLDRCIVDNSKHIILFDHSLIHMHY